MRLLGQIVWSLLDLLSPPTCAACDAGATAAFCDTCRARMLAQPLPADGEVLGVPLVVAGAYEPPLSTAIVRFKYEGRAELSRGLSQLLVPSVRALSLQPCTAFVPVPLHPRRLAARGYNQAALLAQDLAKAHGSGCRPRLLQRTRETARQVGKARAERLTNANDAFTLRPRQRALRHAVLVDDVITTGSTVRACAQALALGGVELCAVVALAQALSD